VEAKLQDSKAAKLAGQQGNKDSKAGQQDSKNRKDSKTSRWQGSKAAK
jgi:hypothetical protein